MNTPPDDRPLPTPAGASSALNEVTLFGTNYDGALTDGEPERDDDDDYDNGEHRCHECLGDGYVFGDDMGDPDWYEPGKTYRCPCCNGSGDAKDCTYW